MDKDPVYSALFTGVIIDNIMSQLKFTNLLNCRKVCKFWNQAASVVLRKRSTMTKRISNETQLMELDDCILQSCNRPFVGLRFDKPWNLNSPISMNFFVNHGASFTRLRLDVDLVIRLQDLAPFIDFLPCLTILEIGWSGYFPQCVDLLTTAAGQNHGKLLNISSVQTIRILSRFTEYEDSILQEVVSAACFSVRIECLDATYRILRSLERAGKIQAVSILNAFEERTVDATKVVPLFTKISPMLTKLRFHFGGCISVEQLASLLFKSQNTLKELDLVGICPSDFLSECPVLSNLNTLSVRVVEQFYNYVFEGRHGHKFPSLQELKIDTTYHGHNPWIGNWSDNLFVVPSLMKITINGYIHYIGIENLARSFPNVSVFQLQYIVYNFVTSFDSDPTEIWGVSAFRFLEKLIILDYTIKWPAKLLKCHKKCLNFRKLKNLSMDSFLTGIPPGICENLRKQNFQNTTNFALNEVLRDSPSILQLKNLKELIICLELEYTCPIRALPAEPAFISMVSVLFALQKVPNLKIKFLYQQNDPSSISDRVRAAFLEALFKPVQKFISLEPYYV